MIMSQTFGAGGQPDAEPFVIKKPTVANNFSQMTRGSRPSKGADSW